MDSDANLTLIKGKLEKSGERKVFLPADHFFVDAQRSNQSQQVQKGLAVALAIMGDSGGASSALVRSGAEIAAHAFEFSVDHIRFAGYLECLPFENGDDVEVVAAQGKDGETCVPYAVARPVDRLIALRPHCVRGRRASLRRMTKRTVVLTALVVVVSGWIMRNETSLASTVAWSVAAGLCGAALFSFIEWRLYVENLRPLVHLTERILTRLGVSNAQEVDLVLESKRTRTGSEPPGFRWQFYRY